MIVAILVIGGYIYIMRQQTPITTPTTPKPAVTTATPTTQETPTTTPTTTPTETPEETISGPTLPMGIDERAR